MFIPSGGRPLREVVEYLADKRFPDAGVRKYLNPQMQPVSMLSAARAVADKWYTKPDPYRWPATAGGWEAPAWKALQAARAELRSAFADGHLEPVFLLPDNGRIAKRPDVQSGDLFTLPASFWRTYGGYEVLERGWATTDNGLKISVSVPERAFIRWVENGPEQPAAKSLESSVMVSRTAEATASMERRSLADTPLQNDPCNHIDLPKELKKHIEDYEKNHGCKIKITDNYTPLAQKFGVTVRDIKEAMRSIPPEKRRTRGKRDHLKPKG